MKSSLSQHYEACYHIVLSTGSQCWLSQGCLECTSHPCNRCSYTAMTKPFTKGLKHLHLKQEAHLRSGILCSPIPRVFSKNHFHHYPLLPQQSWQLLKKSIMEVLWVLLVSLEQTAAAQVVFGHRLDHIPLSYSKVEHSSDCMDSLWETFMLISTGAHSQGSTHMKWHRPSSQHSLLGH